MDIQVMDPFGAVADEAMPTLRLALDPMVANSEFKRRLPRLSGTGRLRLKGIRVTRHKPGRRCVIEYDVEVDRPDMPRHQVTLIGKVRARRSGNEGFRQLESIWNAGFEAESSDGISVPEPIGVIADFQMWFQRKVAGETVTDLLRGTQRLELAKRVAASAHKVHAANVPVGKTHLMVDELRILRDCLGKVAINQPQLQPRLALLTEACERLGNSLPAPTTCGIHRDFYPAQIIVDGARTWLIDFDLYCMGDPGLDVGNFIGHVIEQALREHGNLGFYADVERTLEEHSIALGGGEMRASIRVYTTLTLARHIYLSQLLPGRELITTSLLELCEQRVKTS